MRSIRFDITDALLETWLDQTQAKADGNGEMITDILINSEYEKCTAAGDYPDIDFADKFWSRYRKRFLKRHI